MAATVTLATTTLAAGVGMADGQIKVASTAGITPKMRLFIDGELMEVVSLAVDPWLDVRRGVDGTAAKPHISEATVWIGRADQFFDQDPVGAPPPAVLVSPHINAVNGTIWFAQGNPDPAGQAQRWWQKQTQSYSTGPFGVLVQTPSPTSST